MDSKVGIFVKQGPYIIATRIKGLLASRPRRRANWREMRQLIVFLHAAVMGEIWYRDYSLPLVASKPFRHTTVYSNYLHYLRFQSQFQYL